MEVPVSPTTVSAAMASEPSAADAESQASANHASQAPSHASSTATPSDAAAFSFNSSSSVSLLASPLLSGSPSLVPVVSEAEASAGLAPSSDIRRASEPANPTPRARSRQSRTPSQSQFSRASAHFGQTLLNSKLLKYSLRPPSSSSMASARAATHGPRSISVNRTSAASIAAAQPSKPNGDHTDAHKENTPISTATGPSASGSESIVAQVAASPPIPNLIGPYRRQPLRRSTVSSLTRCQSSSSTFDSCSDAAATAGLMSGELRYGRTFAELDEEGWYNVLASRRHHPYPREEVPYWMSYEPEALVLNAVTLATKQAYWGTHAPPFVSAPPPALVSSWTSFRSLRPPARVLDVGCGPSASWCIGLAREKGFEKTEFVGLDVCPVEVGSGDDGLKEDLSDRLSFVRHNFLEGKLPFEDNTFDYVHGLALSPGVPDESWAALVDELVRVAKPGSPIELADWCFQIPRPPLPASTTASPAPASDPFATAYETFEATLTARKLSSNAIDAITKVMETRTEGFWETRSPPAELPSTRPTDDEVKTYLASRKLLEGLPPADGTTTDFRTTADTLHETGFTNPEGLTSHRVFTFCLAQAISANRELFWEEAGPHFVSQQQKHVGSLELTNGSLARRSSTAANLAHSMAVTNAVRQVKEAASARHEFDATWNAWQLSVESRSGISDVLSSAWGWTCTADEEAKAMLEQSVTSLDKQVAKFDAQLEARQRGDVTETNGEGWTKEDEARLLCMMTPTESLQAFKDQAKRQKSAAQVELINVKRRLDGEDPGTTAEDRAKSDHVVQAKGMGSIEFGTMIGYKADAPSEK